MRASSRAVPGRAGRTAAVGLAAALVAAVVATTVGGVTLAGGAVAATTPPTLTVSGLNTVGFPFVQLLLHGVPGLGVGDPPPITVTQLGQSLRTTTSWALSAGQPIAVVLDVPAKNLEPAQALVAELVQDLPPEVPLALVSAGGSTAPIVNRDAFMTHLSRQQAGTASTATSGIATAAAAGVQHVFVVSTCDSPAPTSTPLGEEVDLLGVGPACTAAWHAAGSVGDGAFTAATSFTAGLAALDQLVAGWRSSVVVVASALTRDPVQLSTSGASVTTAIDPVAKKPVATSPGAPRAAAGSSHSSGAGRVLLVIGILGLLLAGLLVLVLLRARRRREPVLTTPAPHRPEPAGIEQLRPATTAARKEAEPVAAVVPVATVVPVAAVEPESELVPEPVAEVVPEPVAEVVPEPVAEVVPEPAAEVEPERVAELVAEAVPEPVLELELEPVAVRVIDLREQAQQPEPAVHTVRTQMAVATQLKLGEAGQPERAVVAAPVAAEEPVVVADEHTPDEIPATDELVEPAEPEQVELPELAEPELVEEVELAPEMAAEVEPEPQPESEPEPVAKAEPVAEAAPDTTRGEFDWAPLSFSPLVWRYDAEPEQPVDIDLREPAAVDVREDSGRKAPRRKKARR
jgi:hypothetical protein